MAVLLKLHDEFLLGSPLSDRSGVLLEARNDDDINLDGFGRTLASGLTKTDQIPHAVSVSKTGELYHALFRGQSRIVRDRAFFDDAEFFELRLTGCRVELSSWSPDDQSGQTAFARVYLEDRVQVPASSGSETADDRRAAWNDFVKQWAERGFDVINESERGLGPLIATGLVRLDQLHMIRAEMPPDWTRLVSWAAR
ncbi:MAG: hypothetical protein ACF8Q5_05830 [Phycisphaerales bacterium JB040]